MALVINNNTYSLRAQSALNKVSTAQGKLIQQLSTGMRINTGADDASGLAISEKLRGQISGLKRASMNAQDGLSYLQSVDGSMAEVSSMLLRVRELAIQAGNGIYSSSDRAVIQVEVDQLKEEINRVSRASEFNTKKLLNGDATAVWSSDRNFLKGVVRGPAVTEGNYAIAADVTPGTNSVYKSNIMSVNKGTLVAEITARGANMNLSSVREPIGIPLTNNMNVVVGNNGAIIADSATIAKSFKKDGSNWTPSAVTVAGAVGGAGGAALDSSGYFEIEILTSGTAGAAGNIGFKYRMMDAATGMMSNWVTTATTTIAAAATKTFTLNGSAVTGITLSDTNLTFTIPDTSVTAAGDKMIGFFEQATTAAGDWNAAGGGTIKLSAVGTASYPRVNYTAANSLTKTENNNGTDEFTKVPYYLLNMDEKTGYVTTGSITLEFKEALNGDTIPGAATLRIRDEGVAAMDTKLSDIISFTTPDGTKVLGLGQDLTIYANGKSVSIYLEPSDRIEDLVNKLSAAIIKDLGLGADAGTAAGRLVNQNLVKYVTNIDSTPGSDQAVPGTLVIQTAAIGKLSNLSFIADEKLMKALNIATIREATPSNMKITVTDAHTGTLVGSDEVSDGILRNVIKGIDIVMDQTLGLSYSWNDVSRMIDFTKSSANNTAHFHVVDTRAQLQIGANEGQTMNISVGQLDTTGLEIDDLYVVDMKTSQEALGKVDKALTRINGLRANAGAYMNRLQYTISNLDTIRENLVAAESRIRDLDVASASTDLAKNQILMQTATAMIAQANTIPQTALTLIRGN